MDNSIFTEKQEILVKGIVRYQLLIRNIDLASEESQFMTHEFRGALLEHVDIFFNYMEPLLDKGAKFSEIVSAWESYMEWYDNLNGSIEEEERWDSMETALLPLGNISHLSEIELIRECFLKPFYGEPVG